MTTTGPEVRPARTLQAVREVAGVIARLWGPGLAPPELLRALSLHGNPILGAYVENEIVGGQMSFLGLEGGELQLHSHITGVLPDFQHAGVGTALKLAQREWCLAHGIEIITWTFDPMLARNAHFNLRKLGCMANMFHRDFYGALDDEFNRGDRSDRLEVRWELSSERVVRALEGSVAPSEPSEHHVLVDPEGASAWLGSAASVLIYVPRDYLSLRSDDPERAKGWRGAVAAAFEGAFSSGYRAVDFIDGRAYLLVK